jgi:ketosteroid isomerase-like protein
VPVRIIRELIDARTQAIGEKDIDAVMGCYAPGVVAFWTRGIETPGFSVKRFGAWLGGMVVAFGLASSL